MKPETLKALKASIRKWEQIVEGTGTDNGSENCALCQRFSRNGWVECKLEDEVCPVVHETGWEMCHGSPYTDWQEAVDDRWDRTGKDSVMATDDETVMCAVLELEFLKSLLPCKSK